MEDGMSICFYCANTRADKCTWFNPVKQVMPEWCEFDEKVTAFCVLRKITKCPNFTEDTGGSDVRAEICPQLIQTLNGLNEKDYISYFESLVREVKKPKKNTVIDDYGDFQIKRKFWEPTFLTGLIEIERLYRNGFFGLFSDEDAQVMIDKLRSKARAKIEQRKRGRRS